MRRKNDYLWKGILEHVFDDFLRFFFQDADKIFDLERGFTFLDKELADLFPHDKTNSPKFVDKLVKVYTKGAPELPSQAKWILIHVEVQGYKDNDFAWRMHTYFYRIMDRYRQPVSAIAILTDPNSDFHPRAYEYDFLGTSFTFRYNTYKVLEQNEQHLVASENPFAIVILTVLLAIRNKKLDDENLFELKHSLLRNLYRYQISQQKIDALLIFLQLYVRFQDQSFTHKFEKVVEEVTKNTEPMGIRELVFTHARQEGLEEGLKEGIKEGIEKGMEIGLDKARHRNTQNMLAKGFQINEICDILEVSEEFVLKIRNEQKER